MLLQTCLGETNNTTLLIFLLCPHQCSKLTQRQECLHLLSMGIWGLIPGIRWAPICQLFGFHVAVCMNNSPMYCALSQMMCYQK